MNKICISGRIANDLELKTTNNGTEVCSFAVAVDRPGVKDKTDFLDCVAWRKKAEFVTKYFAKGDPIELTGVLTSRTYEDRDGKKRKVTEIVCEDISFPKQKKRREVSEYDDSGYDEPAADQFTELDEDDGELPF